MIAAIGVIVSHSFPITMGYGAFEPLKALAGESLGWFCVAVFFYISGFLIARSYVRRPSLTHWSVARFLRLFPGLFVVLVLTVLLFGPLTTVHSIGDYAADPATWTYLPRNLSLYSLQWTLPGVIEGNPYGPTINGSLWTLFYEVICYAGVFVAGMLGLLERPRMFAISVAVFILLYVSPLIIGFNLSDLAGGRPGSLMRLAFPFVLGMMTFVYRDHIRLDWRIAVVLWLIAAPFFGSDWFTMLLIIALNYSVLILAYVPRGVILAYNRLGDFSYGTYIYAFPMQQLAVHLYPGQAWYENVALALAPTLILAVASWKLVEKPSLGLVGSLSERMVTWKAPRLAEER